MISKKKNKLIGVKQLANWKSPGWLIENLVPEGSMSVLYGPPKGGKSFLALDWAMRLSLDGKSVVYIAGEGLGGLGARIRAWGSRFDSTVLEEAIPLLFPSMAVNLFSAGDTMNFLNLLQEEETLARYETVEDEVVERKGRVDLIVVDTIARCMIGADENDAGNMSTAIDHLDFLRRETGAATLILHHSIKSNNMVERGSTALRGAADAMLRLNRKDGLLRLEVEAARDFESGRVESYKTEKEGDSLVLLPCSPADLEAHEAQKAPAQEEFLECLANGITTIADVVEKTGRSRPAVVQSLQKLIAKGAVERVRHGEYKLAGGGT